MLIADDHPLVREGVKRILEAAEGIRIVGEVGSADQVLPLLRERPCDVLLLDISMQGPGFFPTLRHVLRDCPRLHVLVLSVFGEELYAARALRAGASGYLNKRRSAEELVAAIRAVAAGEKYLSSDAAAAIARHLSADQVSRHEALSDREFEVLSMLGSGFTIKEIALRLKISPKTVSTYRARVIDKMHLETNADFVRYVNSHGMMQD